MKNAHHKFPKPMVNSLKPKYSQSTIKKKMQKILTFE